MTPTSASPVQPPVLPDQEELIRRLLSDTPLLKDTPDHLLQVVNCLLYTSPSPRDGLLSRMPSSA